MRRYLTLVVGALLLSLVLSTPLMAKTTVTIWGWWDVRMELFKKVIDEFEVLNPDIEIQIETVPFDALWQRALPAIASGTGPSLLLGKIDQYLIMVERGVLEPFPKDVFSDEWVEENYPTTSWDGLKHNGRYYIFPGGIMGDLLMYNREHFKEVGLDPDMPPKTWEEFVDAAKKLTVRDSAGNIVRAGFIPGEQFTLLTYVYQKGGDIVRRDENGRQIANMTSPEVVEALKYLTEFYTEHKVLTPGYLDWTEGLGTGKTSMVIGESFIIGELAQNYPDTFDSLDYATPPTPTGNPEPYSGRKSTILLLMANARRPEEEKDAAMKFLEYIYKDTDKLLKDYAELLMAVPPKASLFDDPDVLATPGMNVLLETLNHQKDAVQLTPEVQTLIDNTIDRVILQGMTPEESLEVANRDLQTLLDDGVLKFIQ